MLRVDHNDPIRKTEIEVERKFLIKNVEELEEKLLAMDGFTRVACQTFKDSYYDIVNEPTITLKDHWLRYREYEKSNQIVGKWQLKKPAIKGKSSNSKETSVYEEVEGLNAVKEAISIGIQDNNTTKIETDGDDQALILGLLESNGFQCFASFSTQRSSWTVAFDQSSFIKSFQIDLDVTNFSHKVGEIEAIVYNESDIKVAQDKVKALVDILDLTVCSEDSSQRAEGKLERYLRENRPEHYEACIKAGIL